MNASRLILCAFILLLVCISAFAAPRAYEYHRDARMQLEAGGSVENTYGYVYVVTDKRGHGVIQVMFSNGSRLDRARFNAQLTFLDDAGMVVREESFSQRIEAADADGAVEHRLSKLVDLKEFASLEVDFYLTDIPLQAGNLL